MFPNSLGCAGSGERTVWARASCDSEGRHLGEELPGLFGWSLSETGNTSGVILAGVTTTCEDPSVSITIMARVLFRSPLRGESKCICRNVL